MLKSVYLSIGFLCLGITDMGAMIQIHSIDTLSLVWTCSAPFERVESVVFDKKRECIYVSNGKDYKIGEDGFIAKVSWDGELVDLKWIKNLNRPTGMAIHADRLYVADVNALLIINLNTATVEERIEVPLSYGINDVAIGEKGTVWVTASAISAVLKLVSNNLEIWIQEKEHLLWANGIQAYSNTLLVGGEYLNRLDLEEKGLERITTAPKVRDFEGVAQIEEETFLVTTVDNSALHLIQNGKSVLLLQPEGYFGDLEFLPNSRKLILTEGSHKDKNYQVKCYLLQ